MKLVSRISKSVKSLKRHFIFDDRLGQGMRYRNRYKQIQRYKREQTQKIHWCLLLAEFIDHKWNHTCSAVSMMFGPLACLIFGCIRLHLPLKVLVLYFYIFDVIFHLFEVKTLALILSPPIIPTITINPSFISWQNRRVRGSYQYEQGLHPS